MVLGSLYRDSGQTIQMQTENLGVAYYVKKDFKNEYKGVSLQKVEKSVEEDYVSNIRNNCWKERQQSKLNLRLVFSFFSYRYHIEILQYSAKDEGLFTHHFVRVV